MYLKNNLERIEVIVQKAVDLPPRSRSSNMNHQRRCQLNSKVSSKCSCVFTAYSLSNMVSRKWGKLWREKLTMDSRSKSPKKQPYLKCLMNVYRYTMFKVNTTCCFLDFRPSADRQTSLILNPGVLIQSNWNGPC